MARLSDVVKVGISAAGGGLSLPGFGVPLILGAHDKTWPERVRYYSDLAGVAADFATGSPEHLAARAVFSQNPCPSKIAVGRCVNRPIVQWAVRPIMPQAGVLHMPEWKLYVGGRTYRCEYEISGDVQGASTPDAAVSILQGLINADTSLHGCNAVRGIDSNTGTMFLSCVSQRTWQSVEVNDPRWLRLEQATSDPGIAADLDAIRDESDDWYCIINPWNSAPIVKSIAAWTEANEKLFIAQTQDTEVIDTPATTATDAAQRATTNGYRRTALVYSPDNGDFLDAAIAGRLLPFEPGSETWALKDLAGVPATKFLPNNIENMKAKRCGWYYAIAGLNVTQQGKVASASTGWIDVTRFVDWLRVDMQARIFTRLAEAAKVPFTDAGAAIIQGEIQASLDAGVRVGGLVPGSVSVKVPKAGDLSATDRANRVYSGITFTGRLAGAAHEVIIQGTVTA